jgi:hypothetical protein
MGMAVQQSMQRFIAALPGPQGLWASVAVGVTTYVAWYLFLRPRGDGAGAGGGRGGGDPRRLRRLANPPGDSCTEEEWGQHFQTSLHTALMQLRDMRKPGLIMIILEGDGRDAATLRLRQWVWPDQVTRDFLQRHTAAEGPAHVVPVRLMSGSDEAKLVLEVFKRQRSDLPLMLVLWGKPQARLMMLQGAAPRMTGTDIVRILQQMLSAQAADSAELGDENLNELRRQQANSLLGAHSNMTARQLIQGGRFNPRDFVAETEDEREMREFGGLSEEERAMIASAEAAAAADRAELQAVQQEEYEQAEAMDRSRAEAEAMEQQRIEKQQEEDEAAEIWKKFEKEHKLESLPPEPADGGLKIVITMPGSGRRVTRRWSKTDTLQHLFDYCSGNAADDEEFVDSFALVSNFPTKRHTDGELTLEEAGLETNMVLRVSE